MCQTKRLQFERGALSSLTLVVLLLGIALRLASYFCHRSLWQGEAHLATRLWDMAWINFLQPWNYEQTAPAGVGAALKGMLTWVSPNEYSLRFLPLVAGLVSCVLFWRLGKRVLSASALLIAVALFSFSNPLIYFSSEVKQYSIEVVVTLLLYLFVLPRPIEGRPHRFPLIPFSILAAVAPWFSHPSCFVVGAIGVVAVGEGFREKDLQWIRGVVLSLLPFLLSLGILYYLSVGILLHHPYLRERWKDSFFQILPSQVGFLHWEISRVLDIFTDPVGLAARRTAAGLFLLGTFWWLKRDGRLCALLGLPLVFTFVASCFRLYPFYGRLLQFAVPSLILGIAAGADFLLHSPWRVGKGIALGLLLFLFAPVWEHGPSLFAPRGREELRPLLQNLAAQVQPEDGVYVAHGAGLAFEYYRRLMGFSFRNVGVGSGPGVVFSAGPEFSRFGQVERLWLVFSHLYADPMEDEVAPRLNYLDCVAKRIHEVVEPGALLVVYERDPLRSRGAKQCEAIANSKRDRALANSTSVH